MRKKIDCNDQVRICTKNFECEHQKKIKAPNAPIIFINGDNHGPINLDSIIVNSQTGVNKENDKKTKSNSFPDFFKSIWNQIMIFASFFL